MADEEDVQIVEEGEYTPKQKPKLDKEVKDLLNQRKKPKFCRQQEYQYKRINNTWRRPRGRHSKQRKGKHYRPPCPRIGYGTPKKVRTLHPSGFVEVLVHNTTDIEKIDQETQAIRIARTVGGRKRAAIIELADEMGIRVLNRGV
jgi:large subunit ribosomal protein L32e